jgi:CheY-like chemotaxis protein
MDSKAPPTALAPLVLVVDADARSASLLARLLRADGYEAEVTTDGAAAVARLARNPVPDVVITDFHLAHADGLAVARYARSRRPSMHVVLVTGYPNALTGAAKADDQPLHILTKPLDYPDLLALLVASLGALGEA